jgi:hypothetical protein
MPDPRLVGLHELRALIKQPNEAILRSSHAGAQLAKANVADDYIEDLDCAGQTVQTELLSPCVNLLKRLEGGTLEN